MTEGNKESGLEKKAGVFGNVLTSLVPITAWGIMAVTGLSIGGAFNYTMNTIHLKKSGIPKEDVEFFSLFSPGYFLPMYKGEYEKANPGYKLKSNNKNHTLDSNE